MPRWPRNFRLLYYNKIKFFFLICPRSASWILVNLFYICFTYILHTSDSILVPIFFFPIVLHVSPQNFSKLFPRFFFFLIFQRKCHRRFRIIIMFYLFFIFYSLASMFEHESKPNVYESYEMFIYKDEKFSKPQHKSQYAP